MAKQGSVSAGKDAAHKMSLEVYNHVSSSTPGRPLSSNNKSAVSFALNDGENLRIKTSTGNRSTDRVNDARIMEHYSNGTMIDTQAAAARAQQSYKGCRAAAASADTRSAAKNLTNVAEQIGDMPMRRPDGSWCKVKNADKY